MLSYEEAKVLCYLQGQRTATVEDVATTCLKTSSRPWAERVLAELDWLGLVAVLPGSPAAVQLTERGTDCLGRLVSPAAALA